MIRITKSEDLKHLSNYPKLSGYIADMLNRLINEYSDYCTDGSISPIGAILFLENLQDFDNYKAMGLYKKLSLDSFEWVISFEEYNIACVVIDNDYAVNLVCSKGLYSRWLNAEKKGAKNELSKPC